MKIKSTLATFDHFDLGLVSGARMGAERKQACSDSGSKRPGTRTNTSIGAASKPNMVWMARQMAIYGLSCCEVHSFSLVVSVRWCEIIFMLDLEIEPGLFLFYLIRHFTAPNNSPWPLRIWWWSSLLKDQFIRQNNSPWPLRIHIIPRCVVSYLRLSTATNYNADRCRNIF